MKFIIQFSFIFLKFHFISAQNRNWNLFSNLIRIINDENTCQEKITLCYLVKGHTFNSCDSLHASISQRIKREHEIFTPSHFIELVQSSRVNIFTKEVNFSDIIMFKDESKSKKSLLLENIKQFEVRKNSINCFIKFDHNSDFHETDILNQSIKKLIQNNKETLCFLPKQLKPVGISSDRFDNLQKLKTTLKSQDHQQFYDDLIKIINENDSVSNKKKKIS